jgi:hypothetical protein
MHRNHNRNPNKVSLFPLLPPVKKHEQIQSFYLRVIPGCRLLGNTRETRTKNTKSTKIFGWYVVVQSQKLQQGTGYLYFASRRDSVTQPGVGRRPTPRERFFKRRYATSLLLSGLPWAEAHGYHKLSRCDNLEKVVPS